MRKGKKLAGFILMLAVILIVLQVSSIIATKNKRLKKNVLMSPKATFLPQSKKIPQKQEESPLKNESETAPDKKSDLKKADLTKQVSQSKANLAESKSEENNPEPKIDLNEPKKLKSLPISKITPELSQNPEAHEENIKPSHQSVNNKMAVTTEPELKTQTGSKSGYDSNKKNSSSVQKNLETISIPDEQFIDLDRKRDEMIDMATKKNKEVKGIYGWGVLNDYENPDLAHRILGGIPFAIDNTEKRYYRIYPDKKLVQPAIAVKAYGTTGIEANDKTLSLIVKKAIKKGHINTNPYRLSYFYLFSINTESYIQAKVVNAFEWFIQCSKFNEKDSKNFRENARLRIGVWKATRVGGGEMGIVIPVYFDFNDKKHFFPESYYQYDYEAASLGINIDPKKYL